MKNLYTAGLLFVLLFTAHLEKIARSNQLLSLNLRLKNYGNALFNLNRINENGNVYYSGRIVNIDHGDLLILKKEKEKYFFIKQQQRFSMVE